MPIDESTLTAEQQEEYRKIRLNKDAINKHEREFLAKIGAAPRGGSVDDLTLQHQRQNADTAAWDRMTQVERLELWRTNREKWQELLDAKEISGLRLLYKS